MSKKTILEGIPTGDPDYPLFVYPNERGGRTAPHSQARDRSANRGMAFETLIRQTNDMYKREHGHIITKQNTAFLPIRDHTGKVVNCKVTEKATVDFIGRLHTADKDIPIAFDTKHKEADFIELARLEEHQFNFLNDWIDSPFSIGFVLVSFCMKDFYLIPFEYWRIAVRARKEAQRRNLSKFDPADVEFSVIPPWNVPWKPTGKASIRQDELPQEWRVKSDSYSVCDYARSVFQMLQDRKGQKRFFANLKEGIS
jgi:penicillin-binding protein-related factor A (putative recombinase)